MKFPIIPTLNTLTLLGAISFNYLVNAGMLGATVGQVSAQYQTLLTPAGYAFSIWGFIYLALLLFVGYQWYVWAKERKGAELTGIWLMLTNVANGFWVYVWIQEYIGLSVFIMFVLLFSLIMLVSRLNMEKWDAPLRIIAFVWWPIVIYLGWMIVVTVTNVAAWLVSIGYSGAPLSPEVWAVIMIGIATAIYLLLLAGRNLREAAVVGVWGLVAIAVKQWEVHPAVVWAALIASGILLLAIGYHGYKNRSTSPVMKWKRGEV